MKENLKVAVIGLGGVGGYFGYKLASRYNSGTDVSVTFIARSETYNQIATTGLLLFSPEHPLEPVKPHVVRKEPSELDDTDIVLICVKAYDLRELCLLLKAKVKTNTVIIPLMNGVNIYESIRERIDTGIILPSCVYVASHIRSKGVIEHKGKPGKIICGQDPLNHSFHATKAIGTLLNAGIDIEFTEDPYPAIWRKFLFIASFGLISARYNQPIGEIVEKEILHNRAELIMQEILSIARKKSIYLPEDIIEQTFQKAATFPYNTPTSLQLDIHSDNKNNELELFGGAIMKYGQLTGTDTTQTAKIIHEWF